MWHEGQRAGLIHAAMKKSGQNKFLIDGFPRALDQAAAFERMVCESTAMLFLDCPEDVMQVRALADMRSRAPADRAAHAAQPHGHCPSVRSDTRHAAPQAAMLCLDCPEAVMQVRASHAALPHGHCPSVLFL